MNKEELKALVAQMLEQMQAEPPVKAGDYRPTQPVAPTSLADLGTRDLRREYAVENPHDGKAFLELKAKTPARLGLGRAGCRYKTDSFLRFRADHAAAQDSVFTPISEDFAKSHGFVPLQTRC